MCLLVTGQIGIYAQGVSDLSVPGTMISLSPPFEPVLIKGLKVHPENPFLFDFIIDAGQVALKANDPYLKEESNKLIKYFFTAMTVPEKDLWVNLSPYEKDRMIAPNLGQTEMGRDMLAQDYTLKQLTASLIYPENNLGKEFWDRIYAKAQQMYGTTQVPVNTFNKVWIVADKANVFERGNVAYVVGAHLKVMLEEDYLATTKNITQRQPGDNNTQILRDLIIPEIEQEVNRGKNFAPLRQMYYSMILASWYKMALKGTILTQIYGNQSKVKVGINAQNLKEKDSIFRRYIQAYKKGVFNYVKEDVDQNTHINAPRKYFSGGWQVFPNGDPGQVVLRHQPWLGSMDGANNIFDVGVNASPAMVRDRAMVVQPTIVLADDEPSLLMLQKLIITKAGFIVFVANNSDELEKIMTAHGENVSLIITDTQRFTEAVGRILSKAGRKILVMALSGDSEEKTKKAWEGIPIDSFLFKPYGIDKLVAAVKELLPPPAAVTAAMEKVKDADEAMLNKGGIDLDRSKMRMTISKDAGMGGVQIKFDRATMGPGKRNDFYGFEFQIQFITHVTLSSESKAIIK